MVILICSRRTLQTTPTSFTTTTGREISRTLPDPRALELKLVTSAGERASLTSTTTAFQTSLWLPAMFTPKLNEYCRNTPIKHRESFLGTWAKVCSKSSSRRQGQVWPRHTAVGDARLETSTTTGISTY